jgi:hypothetical protein
MSSRSPVLPFAVDPTFARVDRWLGVRSEEARLELHDARLVAVFGLWRVETALDNVTDVAVTGPYSRVKVIGPPRLSLSDQGLTFATNDQAGLCLRFRNRVGGLVPFGLPLHPALTVTVDEPEQVKTVLERALRDARSGERLRQTERDVLHGLTSSELRTRAEALGVDRAAEMNHDELVALLASGDVDADEPDG